MERAPNPIRSLREDDPTVEEALDTFILKIGEQIDELQDAVLAGSASALLERARAFRADADHLGYPALCEILDAACEAASSDDADGMRKAVTELTEMATRVRRGHRSAA